MTPVDDAPVMSAWAQSGGRRRQRDRASKGRGVIPVEVAQTPWHFTTGLDLLDHWQTVIAGVLALVAAFGTIVVTMIIARRQIGASREEADRVIAATRAQTRATVKQTETTVRLDRMRDASEALAFHAMLEAAMARVLTEAAWARKTYPQHFGSRRSRRVCRGPCRSPVHHQGRVRGIARRLRQAGRPFDRRVS